MVVNSARGEVAEISLRSKGDRQTGWARTWTSVRLSVIYALSWNSIGRLPRESPLDSNLLIQPGCRAGVDAAAPLTFDGFLFVKERRNADGLGMTQFEKIEGDSCRVRYKTWSGSGHGNHLFVRLPVCCGEKGV